MADAVHLQTTRHVLLVDEEFPRDLHERIDSAKERVWLQFMTFEADAAGRAVADRLLAAKARGVDVRLIVDRYTDFMVSDTYHRRHKVRAEVVATKAMWAELRGAGIPVRRTRPLGFANALFLFRDHKKIVVVDDVCYLGGINVSEHNYAWHDFMVRFEDPEVTAACAGVFEETVAGRAPDLDLPCGIVTNRQVEATFDALLAEASSEVVLSAPYAADLDLVRRLGGVPNDVRRVFLGSSSSNLLLYRVVNRYVFERLHRSGVEVWLGDAFTHARFLLVDRSVAFITSSNFGRESLRCKDEIGIVVRDPAFVGLLYDRLVHDRVASMRRFASGRRSVAGLVGWCTAHLMRLGLWLVEPIGRRMTHVLDD